MDDNNEEISAESESIQADPPDYEVVGGEEEDTIAVKLKKLRDELKVVRKERDDYLAGWQRAKADFINARKEDEKAREGFTKFAQAAVLMDLLRVVDSLEMALRHLPAGEAGGGGDGMKQIYGQVRDILKQYSVTQIEAKDKKFNPAEHEAIDKMEVEDEGKDDVVMEELASGWYLHDKVLRPAKVKVGVLKK